MAKQISLNTARCTGLTIDAPVQFLGADSTSSKADFQIEAYTGAVVDRWWGRLAVDVSGILAKQRMPILLEHTTRDIVGYSLKSWVDSSFWVSGRFSKATNASKEVRALAEEGFPWQASIGVRALEVLEISEGEKREVNGRSVAGPAEVWSRSEVFETSFVPVGADGETSVTRFTKFEEAPPYGVNAADGLKPSVIVAGDIERVLAMAAIYFGDDQAEGFSRIVKSGVSAEQYMAINALQPTNLKRELTEADRIEQHKERLLAALSDDQNKCPGDYMGLVEAHRERHGGTKVDALLAVRKANPEAFQFFLNKHNQTKRR